LLRFDSISEGLEQLRQYFASAACTDHRNLHGQREPSGNEFRPLLTVACQCRSEYAPYSHSHVRRCDIGPVIHIVFRPLCSADKIHGIDLEQQTRGAYLIGRIRVKHASFPERQVGGMKIRRILMQQKSEVCRFRPFVGDGQKHLRNHLDAREIV
jgi:hypothetical protein